MIFNMMVNPGLNCSVARYSSFAELPEVAEENTLGVITDVSIPYFGFGEKNPFVTYSNIDILAGSTWHSGYITDAGAISAAESSVQIYSDYAEVVFGETYRVNCELTDQKSQWVAVAEYSLDETTGNYTFVQRVTLCKDVAERKQVFYYTPSSEKIVSIIISLRTHNVLERIECFLQDKEITKESVENGSVWICTASSSPWGFNLLVGNMLQIYPVYVKQYINQKWIQKELYLYQQGWKTLDFILYSYGEVNSELTGGLDSLGVPFASGSGTAYNPLIEYDGGIMHAYYSTASKSSIVYFQNKIDLSQYSSLFFKGKILYNPETNKYTKLCIWRDVPTYWNTQAVVTLQNNCEGEYEIDISALKGEYYIGFGLYGRYAEVYLEQLILR